MAVSDGSNSTHDYATEAKQDNEITKLTSIDGKLNSLGQKTMSGSVPVTVASDQPALPVSAASLPLPSGAATATNQATEIASLASIDTKLSSQATAANQTTELATLASIDAGIPASLGQKTMANSMPVVIASDQSALPVTGTFYQATQPVSVASLPLPAGASTAANQATEIASLASIDAGIPAALGQTTKAASMPVVLPSDQDFATGANQTSEITKLTSIDGKLNTLGQKTMANSVPVVIASDQSTVSVTAVPSDGAKKTYSAAISGLVSAASATDIFAITGSASKTIRILSVGVGGTTSAGSGITVNMTLVKRSSADTAGTSTTLTNVPYDSANGAATAVVKAYTANPTLGATVGSVLADRLSLPTAGAGGQGGNAAVYNFGNRPGQSVVLRGAAEQLCINLGGATITGPSLTAFIEWTEE